MTAALEGGEWSAARPDHTLPVPILQEAGWAPWPVWTGGKSHPHRDWIPDRPAHSQSLYRLSYRAHVTSLVLSVLHEGESNGNLKYVLSPNLLNTKGTQ